MTYRNATTLMQKNLVLYLKPGIEAVLYCTVSVLYLKPGIEAVLHCTVSVLYLKPGIKAVLHCTVSVLYLKPGIEAVLPAGEPSCNCSHRNLMKTLLLIDSRFRENLSPGKLP